MLARHCERSAAIQLQTLQRGAIEAELSHILSLGSVTPVGNDENPVFNVAAGACLSLDCRAALAMTQHIPFRSETGSLFHKP